jgi:PhoPQ-activated pathogenicity-related protein
LIGFYLALPLAAGDYTALDRYIGQPDKAYRWQLASQTTVAGNTISVLEMVSQAWLTEAEVDRTEWKHWLVILKPAKVAGTAGVVFVNGGSNDGRPPGSPDLTMITMATELGVVVADLRMVPNQPLKFAGEDSPRKEDALIAYTWRKFLETGDERWPARLPMTKAVVRAMDTISAFMASEAGGGAKVERFVVMGGSKRGWTTWTAAAVDRRVIAIAPLVIDTLNVEPCFVHHFRVYGFFSEAVKDYEDERLLGWLGTQSFHKLMEIEDPYEYRDRLAIPKYLVNSSGDEFFLPDSAQFYFADLPGEKYLRYVPNTSHSMEGLEPVFGLMAWLESVLSCTPRPRFYWKADRAEGSIRVRVLDPPAEVRMWTATNREARDFRLARIGKAWTPTALEGRNGTYFAQPANPESGYTAFFVELNYTDRGRFPMTYTTEVVVTPDRYPFESPVRLEGWLAEHRRDP